MIEVRIGVSDNPKELSVEIEGELEEVRKLIDAGIEGKSLLWLTDKKGKQVGIPAAKLSYVEIMSTSESRIVGFGG